MPEGKVLVVEDQASFREFLNISLTKLGLEVTTALTGKVALTRAKEQGPDLILLDVMLPDMDGYEICRELRRIPETTMTPIIFVSAVSSEKHIQLMRDAVHAKIMSSPKLWTGLRDSGDVELVCERKNKTRAIWTSQMLVETLVAIRKELQGGESEEGAA